MGSPRLGGLGRGVTCEPTLRRSQIEHCGYLRDAAAANASQTHYVRLQ
jgi:hypothetical protein